MGGMGFAMSNVLILKMSRVLPRHEAGNAHRDDLRRRGARRRLRDVVRSDARAAHRRRRWAWSRCIVLGLGRRARIEQHAGAVGLARCRPTGRRSSCCSNSSSRRCRRGCSRARVPGPREWAGGACIVAGVACCRAGCTARRNHADPIHATNRREPLNGARWQKEIDTRDGMIVTARRAVPTSQERTILQSGRKWYDCLSLARRWRCLFSRQPWPERFDRRRGARAST